MCVGPTHSEMIFKRVWMKIWCIPCVLESLTLSFVTVYGLNQIRCVDSPADFGLALPVSHWLLVITVSVKVTDVSPRPRTFSGQREAQKKNNKKGEKQTNRQYFFSSGHGVTCEEREKTPLCRPTHWHTSRVYTTTTTRQRQQQQCR